MAAVFVVISFLFFFKNSVAAQGSCWQVDVTQVIGCDCYYDDGGNTVCEEITMTDQETCCANQYISLHANTCNWQTHRPDYAGKSTYYCGSQEDTGGGGNVNPDCKWQFDTEPILGPACGFKGFYGQSINPRGNREFYRCSPNHYADPDHCWNRGKALQSDAIL